MAHHRQEVGFGAVGHFRLLAGLDQQVHGLLLFVAGLLQAAGEVIDVAAEVAQFAVVHHRQAGAVVAGLDGLDRIAHGADGLRQARGQATGEEEGKEQGDQGQHRSLEQDFLLAAAEGVVGHAHHDPAQVIAVGIAAIVAGLGPPRLQVHLLLGDGGVEHLHLGAALLQAFVLFQIDQDVVGPVTDFEEAHVGRAQAGLQQALQHFQVAGDHAVLRRRGELVGDELAVVVQLLAQVLQAREGEKARQQQGQQQCRAEADQLGAGMDVPALTQGHRRSSPVPSGRGRS
ncbi:hypothetical protein D3C84_245890 [compost metagenome]